MSIVTWSQGERTASLTEETPPDEVTLEMALDSAVPKMAIDPEGIHRALLNILSNALDAVEGRRNPHVVVSTLRETAGGWVRILVLDNGTGIPAETQAKIFSPNFTTKTSGTGLGLAMCKGIVEQAKGNIWFETKLGEGTSFFVSLPLEMNGVTVAEPVAGH